MIYSDDSTVPMGGGTSIGTLADPGRAVPSGQIPSFTGPKPQEALSRAPEGGPETGPRLPPPLSGNGTRMLAVTGWAGPIGWDPKCTVPRPQETPTMGTFL